MRSLALPLLSALPPSTLYPPGSWGTSPLSRGPFTPHANVFPAPSGSASPGFHVSHSHTTYCLTPTSKITKKKNRSAQAMSICSTPSTRQSRPQRCLPSNPLNVFLSRSIIIISVLSMPRPLFCPCFIQSLSSFNQSYSPFSSHTTLNNLSPLSSCFFLVFFAYFSSST